MAAPAAAVTVGSSSRRPTRGAGVGGTAAASGSGQVTPGSDGHEPKIKTGRLALCGEEPLRCVWPDPTPSLRANPEGGRVEAGAPPVQQDTSVLVVTEVMRGNLVPQKGRVVGLLGDARNVPSHCLSLLVTALLLAFK